ncbi:GrpB family protein [Cryobacterium sp. SO2]|uniref:GrpB family protein n=1 Tax=Cryobacterium sp. SO2 TaxID=1897060 RepID=UPI00223E5D87|nr:GrpB family protein [Cryobacterium sp. SO2]WEO76380.1 GrpB family protein [Cryobacterium sp. SO2]
MSEARDAELDAVLIGGREHREIVVVEYDEAWPAQAKALIDSIRAAVGPVALAVHHIGSTSVPGLAAKPILDLLLVVADVTAEDGYVGPLEQAGWVLRVREEGHRLLRTPARDVHLHVLPPATAAEADYLDLRDWLRVNADDRALYARTKRDLAARDWTDMNYYADAKTPVIAEVLGRARAWRQAASAT